MLDCAALLTWQRLLGLGHLIRATTPNGAMGEAHEQEISRL